MTRRITYIDPMTGQEIISYPPPTVHIPTHIPQQHYPPPASLYPQQMTAQHMTPQWYGQQSEKKGIRASFVVGGLVVGFLAIGIHPALGLGIWGYVLVKTTYWAIKGA
ncbi:MAG: hypothetical protein KDA89_21715 [Planctomycetaceae bacterium]|nr:hypothetical protein [Planctomycetaceae bacterium]